MHVQGKTPHVCLGEIMSCVVYVNRCQNISRFEVRPSETKSQEEGQDSRHDATARRVVPCRAMVVPSALSRVPPLRQRVSAVAVCLGARGPDGVRLRGGHDRISVK